MFSAVLVSADDAAFLEHDYKKITHDERVMMTTYRNDVKKLNKRRGKGGGGAIGTVYHVSDERRERHTAQ